MGVTSSKDKAEPEKPISKEELEKLTHQRAAIANEILTTETTYVKNLDILIRVYLEGSKEYLKPDQIQAIFSIIPDILKVHVDLLFQLEERIRNWNEKTRIGDVFVKNANALKLYTEYVNNYNHALEVLAKCQRKEKYSRFLESCQQRPETQRLDLPSFLIMPIQRIPRYQLLLTDLLKNTRRDHKDYKNLKAAVDAIVQVAQYINEQKRIYESTQKIIELQEKISGRYNLYAPHRRFLSEGDFLVVPGSKSSKAFHYFLFNDLLLLVVPDKSILEWKKKYKVCELAPLYNVDIVDLSTADETAFTIRVGNNRYDVALENAEQARKWRQEFGQIKSQANSMKNLTAKTIPTKKSKKRKDKALPSSSANSQNKHSKKGDMRDPLLHDKRHRRKKNCFCC
jgi:hypothetical protein